MKHKKVNIDMTLTSPNCPAAESLPKSSKGRIYMALEEVSEVNLKLVWEPTWSQRKNVGSCKVRIEYMSKQVITLSDRAAERVKEIMTRSNGTNRWC